MANKINWIYKRTNKQRRERYKKLREAGFNFRQARAIRDFRPNNIEKIIKGERSCWIV